MTHIEQVDGERVITVDSNEELAGQTLMINMDLVHIEPDVGIRPPSERKKDDFIPDFDEFLANFRGTPPTDTK